MLQQQDQDAEHGSNKLFANSRDRRDTTLILVAAIFFFLALYAYMPILSVYALSLGASLSLAGLVVGVYGIGQMVFRIPIGVTSDALSRRKEMIIFGFLVLALSNVAMAVSHNPWSLVVFRVTTALGASTWVCFAVLIGSKFRPERKGTAMGMLGTASQIGQLGGSYLGGRLSQAGSYATPFTWGAVLAVIGGLILLPVTQKRIAKNSNITLRRLAQIAVMPTMLVISGTCVIGMVSWFGVIYTLNPVWAKQVLHMPAIALGYLVMIATAAAAIFNYLSGLFSDRIGKRTPVILGLLIMTLSTAAVPFTASAWQFYSIYIGMGIGWGLAYPPLMALGLSVVSGAEQATAMGVFMSWYCVGMFIGPVVGGTLGQAVGLQSTFLVLAGITLLGVLLALLIPRDHKSPYEKVGGIQ